MSGPFKLWEPRDGGLRAARLDKGNLQEVGAALRKEGLVADPGVDPDPEKGEDDDWARAEWMRIDSPDDRTDPDLPLYAHMDKDVVVLSPKPPDGPARVLVLPAVVFDSMFQSKEKA